MEHTDNVIKALVAASLDNFMDSDGLIKSCVEVSVIQKAIELLKAQEPRVLRLNEIHHGMTFWLEDVDKSELLLAIGGATCHYAKTFITENDRSIAAEDSEYNIRWRAWTSKPTEEQREGVKWDG
jgi:hypothetical protein